MPIRPTGHMKFRLQQIFSQRELQIKKNKIIPPGQAYNYWNGWRRFIAHIWIIYRRLTITEAVEARLVIKSVQSNEVIIKQTLNTASLRRNISVA